MSYIGNTSTTQAFTPAVDYFSGNASTTAFTLSRPVASVAQVQVTVANVPQNPTSAYTISGQTLTFTSAPPSGTNNIYVYYTSPITQTFAPAQGTVNTTSLGTITNINSGASSLSLQTNTTTAVTIDTSQNVGIGITPSAFASSRRALQVGGSSTVATLGLSSGIGEVVYNTYYDGANFKYINTNYAASFDYNNAAVGGFAWRLAPSGTAGNNVTLTEAMRIDSSGRVLIGATATVGSAKFLVAGVNSSTSPVIQAGSSAGAYLTCYNNAQTTGGFQIGQGFASGTDNVALLLNNDNAALVLGTNGTERMRIDSSGNLLVNTTSVGTTAARLLVSGNANSNNIFSVQDTSTTYSGGNYFQVFFNSTTGSAGTISHPTATTVAYNTSSDARLKTNIVDAPLVLDKVLSAKVRSFDWKEDNHHVEYGFVAQELYEQLPEAVGKGDDAPELSNPKNMWQVEYGRLTPMLVKAMQEQQTLITAQAETINALTARVVSLENK